MQDFSSVPIYHHPIKYPVKPNDMIFIIKRIGEEWHIRKAVPLIKQASLARKVLMNTDRRIDKTVTPLDYKIVPKGLNTVITLK